MPSLTVGMVGPLARIQPSIWIEGDVKTYPRFYRDMVVVQSTCPQNGHTVGYLFGRDGWDPLLRTYIPNISQWSLVYKDF